MDGICRGDRSKRQVITKTAAEASVQVSAHATVEDASSQLHPFLTTHQRAPPTSLIALVARTVDGHSAVVTCLVKNQICLSGTVAVTSTMAAFVQTLARVGSLMAMLMMQRMILMAAQTAVSTTGSSDVSYVITKLQSSWFSMPGCLL